LNWFKGFRTISGIREDAYRTFTINRIKEPAQKKKIMELLKAADLGINDIIPERIDINELPKDMPKELRDMIVKKVKEEGAEFFSDIITIHKQYDKNRKYVGDVRFSIQSDESEGTQKFLFLCGPVINSLENGHVLVADELDSKLHPNLVCKIVSLFNSKKTNPKNAQLIFNTHDTNLLSSGLFRRDQIWFTDKNRYGEATLYSLADFKSGTVRKTESF